MLLFRACLWKFSSSLRGARCSTTSPSLFETHFGAAFARSEMMLHEPSGHSQREVNAAHSLLFQATLLLDESRALSYAVVMALAHTRGCPDFVEVGEAGVAVVDAMRHQRCV